MEPELQDSRLERRGLVTVMIDPTDKRSRLMALTPDGMRLLSEVVPIWKSSHGKLEELLTDGEHDRLLNGLKKLL